MPLVKPPSSILIIMLLCIATCGCVNDSNSESDNLVTIWAYDSSAEVAEKAVEIYKRNHPDCPYEFEVVSLGQEDMVEKIKIYLTIGSIDTLPNIFYDEDYNFMEYISYHQEYFVDLTPHISADDYYQYKLINVIYDDKVYAIPYDCGTGTLFYRVDLIEKAGYSEADMTELTWDEYIHIGQKVKSATGVDLLVIIPEGDMEGRLLYQSAGTWFFDEEGNANIANNPGFVSAITTLKRVFDSDIVYKASSWDDMISCIGNEKIVSLVGGSWWAPIISSFEDQSGLWRVAEMPKMTGSDSYSSYSNLGGGNWFIINKENQNFATEFAVEMFGNNIELANYAAEKYYVIPVNKKLVEGLTDSGTEFFGGQKVVTFMSETNQHIKPVKYGLHTYEITYTVGGYVGDYVNGYLSLDAAIAKMQTAAEKVVSSS